MQIPLRLAGSVAALGVALMCARPRAASGVDIGSQHLAITELRAVTLTLSVTSAAFRTLDLMPERFTDYGEKTWPPLAWSGQSPATKSFVLIVEDPAAQPASPGPFVHWVLFNLPGTTTSLPESIPATATVPTLGGALQGQNSAGAIGYVGPHPRAGDPPHYYYFQVFALDTMLTVPPGAPRSSVIAAIDGHILAMGQVIGTFKK